MFVFIQVTDTIQDPTMRTAVFSILLLLTIYQGMYTLYTFLFFTWKDEYNNYSSFLFNYSLLFKLLIKLFLLSESNALVKIWQIVKYYFVAINYEQGTQLSFYFNKKNRSIREKYQSWLAENHVKKGY